MNRPCWTGNTREVQVGPAGRGRDCGGISGVGQGQGRGRAGGRCGVRNEMCMLTPSWHRCLHKVSIRWLRWQAQWMYDGRRGLTLSTVKLALFADFKTVFAEQSIVDFD